MKKLRQERSQGYSARHYLAAAHVGVLLLENFPLHGEDTVGPCHFEVVEEVAVVAGVVVGEVDVEAGEGVRLAGVISIRVLLTLL